MLGSDLRSSSSCLNLRVTGQNHKYENNSEYVLNYYLIPV
jgi:hypothetical protein